jgi:hypothetical protein
MANCDDLFQTFDENISVSSARKKTLRKSRNAIRDRIRKHFKEELKVTVPKFHGQGSYSMDTLVNPLDGCDYDIDDGVYLQHLGDESEVADDRDGAQVDCGRDDGLHGPSSAGSRSVCPRDLQRRSSVPR